MANDIYNYCLVCSEVISSTNYLQLDKFDLVFLLKILLEIPKDSQIINQACSHSNSLRICKPCGVIVKQCKEVNTEISERIQTFWGFQNTILLKIREDELIPSSYKSKQNWVEQCRQFVKSSDVKAFKYPFVFQDLANLLNSFQGSDFITDPFAVTADVKIEILENSSSCNHISSFVAQIPSNSWENLNVLSSTLEVSDPLMSENAVFKEELQFENENDDESNNSDDNYGLCDDNDEKSIANQPLLENFTTLPSNETRNYSQGYNCSWPGCERVLGDKTSLSCHMDRHRGTPKQKCEHCDQFFYSGPDLSNHQKMQHAKNTYNLDGSSIKVFVESEEEYTSDNYEMEEPSSEESEDESIGTNSSESTSFVSTTPLTRQVSDESQACNDSNVGQRKSEYSLVRHPTTGKKSYICSWPGCEKRLANHTTVLAHLDQHKGTPQWKCDHCPHQTYWRSMLVKHLERKHGVIKSKCDRGELLKKYQFILNANTSKYNCPDKTCSKTYKNLRMVKQHFKEKHLKVKEKLVLNPTTRKFEKQDPLKIKEKKGLVCKFDECGGRSFSTKISWQSHMDKHMGTPRQKCEQCGQLFYWMAELFRHQKKLHPKGTNNSSGS